MHGIVGNDSSAATGTKDVSWARASLLTRKVGGVSATRFS